MKKSEIFDLLILKVSEICEVDANLIVTGSRIQSVVDARILTVQYLKRTGLSDDDIALMILRRLSNDSDHNPSLQDLKKKAKTVNKLFSMYSQRCLDSYAFCLMSKDIKEFVREKYKDMYLSGMKELPPLK